MRYCLLFHFSLTFTWYIEKVKLRATLIFSFTAFAVMSIMLAPLASADIDWTRGQPSIRIDEDSPVCNESQEKIIDWTTGEIKQTDVCVVYGKDFDMAYTYGTKKGGLPGSLLRLHSATEFSSLLGVGDVQVVPGTNTVVYNKKGILHPLALVRDFTQALKPEHLSRGIEFLDRVIDFKVNTFLSDYDFLTSATTETGDWLTSFRVSANGRYIIAYFNNTGIVKYNLDTRQTTKILTITSLGSWNSYNQPKIEAVSDDGRLIFLASDGQVVDTEGCGDASMAAFSANTKILQRCRVRDNKRIIGNLVGQEVAIQGARFSGDDNTLAFFAINTEHDVRTILRVVMAATDVKIIKYLALGDSYSSGEGDISYSDGKTNYLPGTVDKGQCHVSYRSYPFLLKEKWGFSDNEMESVACSGARIEPDYYSIDEYIGQHEELRDKNAEEKESRRNEVLNNFIPGVVRQIDFVEKYKPDVITLTAGGNDVGFGQIIAYCASPHLSKLTSCAQAADPQVSANLRKTIDDERDPLTVFVGKLKDVSPSTKVYLVGYPQFIAQDGCLDGSELLNSIERQMVRSSVTRLNNILKLVARDTDVYYVNIEDSLEGGQICQNSLYMTGPLKLGPQKIRLGYMQESYHPNAKGHKRMADAINERIKNDNLSYTVINIPPEENGQRVIRKAVTKDYVGIGSEQTVNMGPGMFHPDGSVDVVGFSNRILLARAKTAHDGSLSVIIKIPSEMEEGYHLLTVTGEGIDGGVIQVQQYITVANSDQTVQGKTAKFLPVPALNDSVFREGSQNILLSGSQEVIRLKGNRSQPSRLQGTSRDAVSNQSKSMGNTSIVWAILVIITGIIVKGAMHGAKKEKQVN